MPDSATTILSRGARATQLELHAAVDLEGREVARVDPDHRRAERDRSLELLGVVRLDERVEPERGRLAHQLRAGGVVEVAEQEQRRVGAGEAAVRRSSSELKKPFASSGSDAASRAARRSSHAPANRSSTSTDIARAPACS